jgi:hypothetical protein
MAIKKRKLPTIRRQYHSIIGLDSGLDYSAPSTVIADTFSPSCEEVTFRDKVVEKSYGTQFFASTNITPLLGTVMGTKQYVKNDEISESFVVHTTSDVYVYNTTSKLLECITEGLVVEDCEDVWAVNGTVTCATSADYRKGTYSIAITIPVTTFTTGIAAYKNFDAVDLSTYTYLHFYIKSSIATTATDLDIRISEENAGGTGGSYEDISVPALTAGVWKEVSVVFAGAGATRNAILSISLVRAANLGAQIIYIDDVMATIPLSGDIDDTISSIVVNDYYVFNNGIVPLLYWDMGTLLPTAVELPGGEALACRAMASIGERLCTYWAPGAPRRVQWTVAGSLSIPPVETDWTASGSGDVDLDSVFGDDVIMTAYKLGNYVVIYGKKTIVMQEYAGLVSKPFSFYGRVHDVGVPSTRAVANIGDKHIFLGWDDIYLFRGGTDVESIGDKVSDELFSLINPTYIHRSFMVYLDEQYEVRLYFPLIGSETPNCYFTYSLSNRSWSRGSRSYTGFGPYKKMAAADTWDTVGTATTTWDEMAGRWDDVTNELLSPLNIYGDSNGIVYEDNESTLNLAGVAIDGWWDTKDFVVGESYRRDTTNWMSLGFEATGDTVMVSYSTDLGLNYSAPVTFTLTTEWKMYKYDINVNSPQVRFRFRNYQLSETFEVRQIELGYLKASDRGTV